MPVPAGIFAMDKSIADVRKLLHMIAEVFELVYSIGIDYII